MFCKIYLLLMKKEIIIVCNKMISHNIINTYLLYKIILLTKYLKQPTQKIGYQSSI